MYVNTLKPSFAKFHSITSPEDLLKIIPSLMTSVALVWQYSGFYSVASNFHRLLRLISNELAEHVRQIIGPNPLICLDEACVNIKLALRVGSAFRGHYLDKKDSVEKMLVQQKEQPNKIQQESVCLAPSKESFLFAVSSSLSFFSKPTIMDVNNISSQPCAWPPRNSPVFTSLNLTMERCNDLLELVQTIEHFNELSAIADQSLGDVHDPALANIFRQFLQTIAVFKCSLTDLMNLEDSGFERSFFEFRSSVKELETQLSIVLLKSMEDCLSMESSLRLLESFQGLISRESSQLILRPKLYLIIDSIQADIDSIGVLLPNYMFDTPTLVNTPVVSAKLLWLQALKQRVNVPIEKIRKAAPYLLQGEKGFILRHSHSELMKKIEHDWSDIISQWIRNVPAQIQQSINEPILRQEDETGEVQVNFSPKFEKIVKEVDYITGPVLNVNCQYSSIISLFSPHKLHEHKSTLEMCIRQYNRLQLSLDPIHLSLFKHKLSLMENLLQQGVTSLNWLSLEIPDFLAQIKADLLNDILPAIEFVKQQSDMIRCIAQTWKKLPNLDVFFNIERVSMQYLKYTYKNVTESARSMLSFSMMQIESIIKETFKYVEVSLKSSEWLDYLSYLDALVYHGLKEMMIYSMWTLTSRAQKYEQGGSIPPIVSVSIQLWDNQIQFYPPLSLHSAIVSVPEIVKDSLESFLLLCKIPCRLIDSDISYYDELLSDGDVYGNVQKIIAHIETSSRQCQSMCKRFSQYSFLWEQDVLATFDDFIHGVGLPHPQKFTRPETVNRTRSASRSAKSRSHSAIPFTHTTQTASCVLESMTGVSDWEFLKPDQSSSTTVSFKSYERNSCKTKKNPTLEDFEGEFSVFQGILERLNNYMDTVDIGWICVDQRSVKHSLISLNNKWMHVYSNYLEKKILCVLNELEVFFNDIEPQVEAINGENMDPSLIMTLVMIFNKVNLEQLVMDGKFGAVHRAVSLLDKFHHSLGHNAKKKFEMVPIKWSSLKKRLSLSKQRVAPFIQSHSEVIIQDLKQFGVEASKHHNLFLSSSCLSHQCDLTVAQSLLKEYKLKLLSLQVRATDLMELQELLQSSVVNFSLLNQFENELTTAQQLWEKKQ
jgi:dynein heavy chain